MLKTPMLLVGGVETMSPSRIKQLDPTGETWLTFCPVQSNETTLKVLSVAGDTLLVVDGPGVNERLLGQHCIIPARFIGAVKFVMRMCNAIKRMEAAL